MFLLNWECSLFVRDGSGGFITESGISLLNEGKSDTLSLWNRDSWVLTVTNNNDVLESGGESLSVHILDVSDLERTWMLLEGLEVSNSTNVVSSNKSNGGSWLELDNTRNALGCEIVLY